MFTTVTVEIDTGRAPTAVDVTGAARTFLTEHADGRDGLLNVFVPHATAGIAVFETGSGSDEDLLATLDALLPPDDRWRHRHGSRGHGRDHVVPTLIAPHATLPVVSGRLALGTWQSLVLIDTNGDNPNRTLRLSFLS